MDYPEVRRILVNPYWCEGSPLRWETRDLRGAAVGIAQLAREARVGMFNLCWWLLDRDTPPALASTYRIAPLKWATISAPTLAVDKHTLTEHAALLTLPQFNALIQRILRTGPGSALALLESEGVDLRTLEKLAYKRHTCS